MILYMAHCPVSYSFYYGKTINTLEHRRRLHFYEAKRGKTGSAFHAAIRKYGPDTFTWHIIGEYTSLDELNEAEKRWIALSRDCGHRLYNISMGGDGGARFKQKNRSPTEDERKRISDSLKKHYASRPGTMTGRTGSKSPAYGKRHTEEVRRKISEGLNGKPKPGNRGSGNGSARRIVCISTGEVFSIATDAAIKYKSDLSSIIKCCKGKVKTVKGMTYAYADIVPSPGDAR